MIALHNITKSYPTNRGPNVVLSDITLEFSARRNVGVLGRNGAGKSTLLRILSGVEKPDSGRVVRKGRVSWPVGFRSGFNSALTGEENSRFVARIYGEDIDRVIAFTYDFSELGHYFQMPVGTYSSGMRARLGFGLSMAVDFDVYLVDEVTAVGDRGFQRKCREAFAERRERSSVIVVSHNLKTIYEYCDSCAILQRGQLTVYDTVDEAAEVYEARG